MEDPFDNNLLGGAQKEVESFGTIVFPEDFHSFTTTIYKMKDYIVISTGHTGRAGLSVWEIGHSKKPVADVASEAGIQDRLTTSNIGNTWPS